jgi:GR25 family glycosyltransferase involved in LPS biosynthesis
MSRILVFMSDNRNLEESLIKAEYNSLVAAINYEYCKINNYDFLYYRPYLIDKDKITLINCKNPLTNNYRHSSWSKLLSTSLALQLDYDYVLYIDSDCIFKDFNQTLEEFIKPYGDNDIIFLNNKPWGDSLPCAGFYICKVNENTKKFLKDWYNYIIPENDTIHPWEQNALWKIFKNYNIGIIDNWMFHEKDQQFLRHVCSLENSNRISYFYSFLNKKNINYKNNINNIKVIYFDTNKCYNYNIIIKNNICKNTISKKNKIKNIKYTKKKNITSQININDKKLIEENIHDNNKYKKLVFGESIQDSWSLINIVDEDNKPTEFIGIKGPLCNYELLDELLKTKKLIGISAYQNFPQPLKNIYDDKNCDNFLKNYEDKIILWCHCFKDPQNYISPGIPLLLYSDSDQFPNAIQLNNLANTVDKQYDFFCSLPNGDWNSWIRGKDIAKKWLNYMADVMNLKICVGGGDMRDEFSDKIVFTGNLKWGDFIGKMNESKNFINFSRYDASPRIIIEALSLNIPVLLNNNILGGWKYINKSTGNFFFYDEPIDKCINNFMNNKYEPLKWMKLNYDIEKNKMVLANTINKLMSYKYEDFIDGIIYINLSNRKDRNISILNELKKIQVSSNFIHRIDAILNTLCGYLGCVDSHIKALEYAKKRKWKSFLILEDDAIFNYPKERILYILSEFLKKYENKWDVFMLSTYWNETIDTDIEFIKKLVYGTTTTSYIVNSHYIDTLLDNFKESRQLLYDEVEKYKISNPNEKLYITSNALDQYSNIIQRKHNWYVCSPYLCIQNPNLYSSTMN